MEERKWKLSLASVRVPTYIGVDPGVARSKGTVFVQQDAAVSRALILLLLFFITFRDGGVRLLITPVNTNSHLKKLRVLVSFCHWIACQPQGYIEVFLELQ